MDFVSNTPDQSEAKNPLKIGFPAVRLSLCVFQSWCNPYQQRTPVIGWSAAVFSKGGSNPIELLPPKHMNHLEKAPTLEHTKRGLGV